MTGSDFTWNKFHLLQVRRVVFPVGVSGSTSICVSHFQHSNRDYCSSDSCPSKLGSIKHNMCQHQQEAKLCCKFIGLHWHVLLERMPPIKVHKTFINCDIFTRNVCLSKLLLQACYKWANFVEEIVSVFGG